MEFQIVLWAEEYEKVVSFYRDVLELPVVGGWDRASGDRGTLLRAGSGIVEIKENPSGQEYIPPQGVAIAIEVEDVDREYGKLRAKGTTVVAELTDQPWGHRNFSVADPNGMHVGFYSVIANRETIQGEAGGLEA